jgi:hypothetical protein
MKRLTLIAFALLAACSKSTTSPVNVVLNTNASITLTGAQTATLQSTDMAVVWNSTNNKGAYNLSQTAVTPGIVVGISWTGEPVVGHFKNTDAGASSAMTVNPNGTLNYWTASVGGTSAAVGTYDLNLTKVSTYTSVSGGKTYNVSGTLDVTMPALAGTGATGTVTMHVVF